MGHEHGSFVTTPTTRPKAGGPGVQRRKLADSHAGASWTGLSAPGTVLKQMPAEHGTALYEAVYGSPYGNDLLLEFAGELLEREQLGKRNATDLFAVSFSSNDSVGHTYGPDSPQVGNIAIRTVGRLAAC